MSPPLPASGLATDLAAFVDTEAPSADRAAPPRRAHRELLVFTLDEGVYALPVNRLREVTRADGIARVPLAPEHVRGVRSIRGQMVPVLDLRTRLGLSPAALSGSSRLVVAEARGRLLAVLVDAVLRVVRLPEAELRPPPPEAAGTLSPHVCGVAPFEQRLALLLDLDGVLALPSANSEASP